jgi:hypothetical protein
LTAPPREAECATAAYCSEAGPHRVALQTKIHRADLVNSSWSQLPSLTFRGFSDPDRRSLFWTGLVAFRASMLPRTTVVEADFPRWPTKTWEAL